MVQIPQISFGETGLTVSRLGLGTVKFGRCRGLRYPPFDLPNTRILRRLLDEARSYGVNLLDTAHAYGLSEERIGALLIGQRSDWVLCTKAGEVFENGVSRFDFRPQHLEECLHTSLSRLKVECVDIFLLHCDHRDSERLLNDDILECLQRFKHMGMAQLIGASTHTIEGGLLAAERLDCVMVPFNDGCQDQSAVIQRALRLGKGVLVKKPLNCGVTVDPAEALKKAARTGAHTIVAGTICSSHLAANAHAVACDR